jgi:hypothetical protein
MADQPTESFPPPDLEGQETAHQDVPRVHAEDPAEGADDESATS